MTEQTHESVVEKTLGGYHLPDKAIDLSAWLRDGLDVYNLFIFMKPLFFDMLEKHGGEFRSSSKKQNENLENPLRQRVRISEEIVGTPGQDDYDHIIIARLVDPETDVLQTEYTHKDDVVSGY